MLQFPTNVVSRTYDARHVLSTPGVRGKRSRPGSATGAPRRDGRMVAMDLPAPHLLGPDAATPRSPRTGARASVVRRHNLSALLECLNLDGSASRSQLGAATGLNRSTVADLVQELAGRGLVVEDGMSPSSGPGRPSPMVHVRASGAVALAVELGVESVAAAAIGLGGQVLEQLRVELPSGKPAPRDTVQLVAELAAALGLSPADRRVAGVGVAVPGLTRRADGFVHLAPNLGWRGVDLGQVARRGTRLAGREGARRQRGGPGRAG